jgi:curli production assembly/transport component CsgE
MSAYRSAIALGVLYFLLGTVASARAAPGDDAERKGDDKGGLPDAYAGVVSNRTITVAGQEFYQNFMVAWRDKELSERYTLSIHERPSARWGSQVWIEFAQRPVFQANLSPSRAALKAVSEQAVEIAYQNIVDADIRRLLFRDQDLAADEF